MIKPYYQSDDGYFTLYHGDSMDVLSDLRDLSIDMIFADPPYFLSNSGFTCSSGKRTSVDKGDWDKSLGVQGDLDFNKQWLGECKRLLTKHGTVWVSGTSHNIFSVGMALALLEFKTLNDITWEKPNPPPNLSCRRFTHSTETILWAARDKKSKYTFNYADMKKENAGKQMKNVWKFASPSKTEKQYLKHPTQKPLALLNRIIKASTVEGNIILDPFNGSGTTGIAAYKLNRKYIGIDINKEYLDGTIKRFNKS